MKKEISRKSKIILTYWTIAFVLILLSLIALAFNEWVLPIGMIICSLCGFVNMLLLLLSEKAVKIDGVKATFAAYIVLRYIMMGIGMLASALLIYFTMGDVVNKYRYLMVIITSIPYFVPTMSLVLVK